MFDKVLSLASAIRVAEHISGTEFTAKDLGELYKNILSGVRTIIID